MSKQLGRSDCGGEISEKQIWWGIEISPTGNLNARQHLKIKKKDVYFKYTTKIVIVWLVMDYRVVEYR